MKTLRTAAIGVGHLGQHHARIYKELEGSELVGVADSKLERAKEVADRHEVPAFGDYRELLDLDLDAVSIAVPTIHHFEVAEAFIKQGIPVLVEKPMTKTVEEAKALVALGHEHNVKIQVGHVERFNPAMMAVAPHIKGVRFIECHRLAPLSFRSADIDVVMDVMIHDIDIILTLVDSPVKSVAANGVPVLLNKEDIANARIEFENGCVANVTASRVSDKMMRKVRMFTDHGYVAIDYAGKEVKLIQRRPDFKANLFKLMMDPEARKDPKAAAEQLVEFRDLEVVDHEPLLEELKAFLDAVRNDTAPIVPGEHGLRAIETAHDILDCIRAGLSGAGK